MSIRGAVAAGLDLVGTVVCRPDPLDGLTGYARFVIPMRLLADGSWETLLMAEVEMAVDDVRRYLADQGAQIGSQALWRAWTDFGDPSSSGVCVTWEGDL